ncbi:peptide/nickel transport system permease protein [Rhodococcus sp. 27YEA15]
MGLVLITFFLIQLIPGDPALAVAGDDAPPEVVEQVRHRLGLDQPLPTQFIDYVRGVLTGDFGESFRYNTPVLDFLLIRLPYTASLAATGIVVCLSVAVPLGLAIAVLTRNGRRRMLDFAFGAITGFLTAIPGYVKATILIVIFAIWLSVLPPSFVRNEPVVSMILPLAAMVIGPICVISRIIRREAADVFEQDYMRTARGWRVSSSTLYLRYALPNLLTTTLTVGAMILTSMIGSAVIIETVFAIPGIGSEVIAAIANRDYPLIQGAVLLVGTIALLLHAMVDILLASLDPRILGRHND